mmetsp:Transcript_349/g.1149  ORF Transcript_349/g.1149 Transcript_349/m.1149 type:complete len:245 (+) Transcript_349:406-1140(+)
MEACPVGLDFAERARPSAVPLHDCEAVPGQPVGRPLALPRGPPGQRGHDEAVRWRGAQEDVPEAQRLPLERRAVQAVRGRGQAPVPGGGGEGARQGLFERRRPDHVPHRAEGQGGGPRLPGRAQPQGTAARREPRPRPPRPQSVPAGHCEVLPGHEGQGTRLRQEVPRSAQGGVDPWVQGEDAFLPEGRLVGHICEQGPRPAVHGGEEEVLPTGDAGGGPCRPVPHRPPARRGHRRAGPQGARG